MIELLESLLPDVYESVKRRDPDWDSLIVNRRKPWTYRVFKKFGEHRVCLHAFDECNQEECFAHPHPWPGAFLLLKGSYVHTVGMSPDLQSDPTFCFREILRPYSTYEIVDRRTWHSVQPLERTYTIMVNGSPWEEPHSKTRTTKGKDLDRMSPEDLCVHLQEFENLLSDYFKNLQPQWIKDLNNAIEAGPMIELDSARGLC